MSTDLSSHPYASFLHEVEKPARYLGGEYNQIAKDPDSVRASLCLAFPDLYDIGMSHLGTKILYSLINKRDDLLCERAFAPWPDMEKALRDRGLPVLSLENRRPLSDFDAVGFSLQYELTFTNVLNLLDLSCIPLRSEERTDADPIILAGGPVATQPEPIAPFIDVFLLGDAEEKLPELLLEIAACRDQQLGRHETLVRLARLGGLYVPQLYETNVDLQSGFEVVTGTKAEGIPERPQRVILEDINRFPFPDDSPVAAAEAIFDRMSVEIARGCTEGCRFCQAGMIYRPVRERDPEQIIDTVLSAIDKGGYDEAGLTTLSTADYSCISPLMSKLMTKLKEKKVSLSVASLRAYGLEETTLDEMQSYRAQGLTFAPEAGTQRMRDVVNKNVTEDDLERTAHRVFERGWKRMKLYFMIGLPTEEDEDVAGIMETGRRMKQIGREIHGGRAGVTVSVSSHVPKPHTPFQWVAMDSLEEIERKQDLLQGLSRRYKLEFRRHDPRTSFLEGILGRGDRRVAKVIEGAFRRGCRFDGWDEHLNWDAWIEAIDESGIDPQLYLSTIAIDARMPWDHLDMQLDDRFMKTDYKRSMKSKLSPPCGKPAGAQVFHTNVEEHDADQRRLVCYHCGVACDLDGMRTERRAFLTKLKSFGRTDREVAATEAHADRMAKKERIERGEAAHDLDQGTGVRMRLVMRKTGADAMTGHLDLVRKVPRIFRRAGLEIFYSEGYHPKPSITFSPALALGVQSVGELLEVKLVERHDPADVLRRLNDVAEAGLEFEACRIVEDGERRMTAMLHRADYLVRLRDLEADPGAIDAAIARFVSATSLPITIRRKKNAKTLDLKEIVARLERATDADCAELPTGLAGGLRGAPIALSLRLDGPGQVKPEEALRALFGDDVTVPPVDIVRLGFWRQDGDRVHSPFDATFKSAETATAGHSS